jgi:hypothetical protein
MVKEISIYPLSDTYGFAAVSLWTYRHYIRHNRRGLWCLVFSADIPAYEELQLQYSSVDHVFLLFISSSCSDRISNR